MSVRDEINNLRTELKEHRADFKEFSQKIESKMLNMEIFRVTIIAKARNNSLWIAGILSTVTFLLGLAVKG